MRGDPGLYRWAGLGCVAALAVGLLVACAPGGDLASSCAAPPSWPPPGAKPGQPAAEVQACLRDQAWQTRTLPIPVASAAQGIVAQCEIRVDQFEGSVGAASGPDADRQAVSEATADVTQYRACAAR